MRIVFSLVVDDASVVVGVLVSAVTGDASVVVGVSLVLEDLVGAVLELLFLDVKA